MGTSGTHEWHHPSFTVDERALPISAEYFALLAEKALFLKGAVKKCLTAPF